MLPKYFSRNCNEYGEINLLSYFFRSMFFRSRLITFSLNFKRKLSTSINFDPCTGCEIPCTKHVSCPPEILKEIDQSTMINSVEKYSRHLCIGQSISSSEWPKHVKDLQGGYMRHLTKIIQEKQNAIGYSIKLTSASMPTKNQSEDTADWYLFPDQVKLVDVNIKQIEEVFEKLFIKKTKEIKCERLNGIWILVCCHFQRDQRCGMSIAFSRGSHVRNFNDVR